jgi:hypothetical protein
MATVNKDFRVKNGLVVEGTTGTIDGNNIITDGDTTDILDEGTSNLYFTDERAVDAVATAINNGTHTNITITYNDEENSISFEGSSPIEDTDDLDEGDTNLYYTDGRVYTKAKSVIIAGTGIDVTADDEAETLTIDVDTSEIATIEYVDAVAEGLHIHASVAVATTENITLSPAPATIDGVSLTEGMRVLVKDQTAKAENGIYVLDTGDLVRAEDHDTAAEVQAGDFVFVEGGTTYNATGWVQLNSVATLGTDPIEWTQFLGAGTFTGGTGIDIDGQEISIDFTEFDTDDIDEGTANLYYTDQRVRDVLTGSQQTNITITEYENQLIIEAENGIADSTTDDLDEGETNLYFTDQRAVDALEAVTPNFQEIEINSVSLQVAATTTLPGTSPVVVYSFDKTEYRSAKFLVKVAVGTHTEISEILLTLDTSDNIAITEYAIVGTNGGLGTITAGISGDNVQISYTLASSSGTATVFGTLIA